MNTVQISHSPTIELSKKKKNYLPEFKYTFIITKYFYIVTLLRHIAFGKILKLFIRSDYAERKCVWLVFLHSSY
jgi:hypothetical protein